LKTTTIQYKYSEDRIINELKKYIDDTYGEHYSQNKFQATEFIMDSGHGEGFCIGNIMKYSQRYERRRRIGDVFLVSSQGTLPRRFAILDNEPERNPLVP
jgi:hypothetical protein